MKQHKNFFVAACSAAVMFIFIIDSKAVLQGGIDGIKLCLWAIIPSLLPFCVISSIISSNISGMQLFPLRILGRLCKIPFGCESIFLIGLLGGYPIGAQSVMQAYNTGTLSKKEASRMLAFCNNAGPSFIFGIVSQLFDSAATAWYIWLITILSSILVACTLPEVPTKQAKKFQPISQSLPQIIGNAAKAMANISAWIVLFRIIMVILQQRVFKNENSMLETTVFGFLELSNGVIYAEKIPDLSLRFILCTLFLNAGGLCVAMQTKSIIQDFSLKPYLCGKVMQTIYSFFLSLIFIPFICKNSTSYILIIFGFISLLFFFICFKKTIAFCKKIDYNKENVHSEVMSMLFRKKMPRSCACCEHGTILNDEEILCCKRGIVPIDHACRKFRYDPCKRVPVKAKAPDFSKYTQDDFSL